MLATLVSLAGCQTGAEYQAQVDASLDARLNGYVGMTMADFMAATSLLPSSAYPVDGGKVFVIEGQPVYMTLPATTVTPAITRASSCQLQVQTLQMDTRGAADSWKIVRFSRNGPCNNLNVPLAPA